MIKSGRFIVVEGLEGAGKSTAIETLRQQLANMGEQLVITREPGGTRLGEKLRALVKEDDDAIEPLSELLMIYAARVQLLEQVIRPALAKGQWVISDRFELSTYAYQGGGRCINPQVIDQLSMICLQGFKPDLIIYLDISPEQGLDRVQLRGTPDRIEQESLSFFNRVHQCYLDKISAMDNVRIVDARLPINDVQESVMNQFTSFLQHHV